MNDYQRAAIIRVVNTCGTNHPTDQQIQLLLLRSARSEYEFEFIRQLILLKRKNWVDWLTVTQRRWQRDTRNPNKARHHDSISIREKYVRCQS